MKKILIVDDEVQILKALSRMFLETNYEVFTADNGMEAMKRIETNDIDMVICDMRMPLLDGYQLLNMVKKQYPRIIRIILSGYTDEKPMFRALLHNVAKLYVFKPWNNTELLENIHKLFEDDEVLNAPALARSISEIGCDNSVPANLERMITLIEEENIESLINELEADRDISSLLIQVGKSAVYGVMPNTVRQAAHYIGLHNLKTFLRWACIIRCPNSSKESAEVPELLIQHAYLTNRIYLFLYETYFHKQPPEAAMFAGLMHNIGLIILLQHPSNKDFSGKTSLTADAYARLDLCEYDMKHQEIGGYLLDSWDLPFPMYEAALYHHRPDNTSIIHHELVGCVNIAQYYAWISLGAAVLEPVQSEIFHSLAIHPDDFERRLSRYLKSDFNSLRSKVLA